MCSGLCFFHYWRRRHVVKPSPKTRVDLAEIEAGRVESPIPMDVAGMTIPVSFPHPYEKVVRRYPPEELRSIEPSRTDDADPQTEPNQQDQPAAKPSHRRPSSETKTMRRHTTPIIPISLRPPIDQLDLDLAHLSGDATDERQPTKAFSTVRPLPLPPIPTLPVQHTRQPHLPATPDNSHSKVNHSSLRSKSNNYSHNKSTQSSRRKRAATITTPTSTSSSPTVAPSNFAKEKYYHRLPPSARYLADVARYPNSVDPARPWNVLKDDIADVKMIV